MKTYIVGGAVRDGLLGLPVQDRDYVVVGATPEIMLKRGYLPVGKDFPVFLHPVTHEEYALARTERKTAPGYKGFVFHTAPDVTLEEDLIRRDLTINAMAQAEDGSVIDPFQGQPDLQAKVFRHVSPAFAEDPLRILRVARFAARFTEFTVAPETHALMCEMVKAGEIDALVPERVWQELSRGLMEAKPSRMFLTLRTCHALERILPELHLLWNRPATYWQQEQSNAGDFAMTVVDATAARNLSLSIRFAALMHDVGNNKHYGVDAHQAKKPQSDATQLIESACKRLKVPNECRDLALLTVREQSGIKEIFASDTTAVASLLERCDAFRKPQRFIDLLLVCECVHDANTASKPFLQATYLKAALHAAQQVNAGEIARTVSQSYPGQPGQIAHAIKDARIAAIGSIAIPAKPASY